MPFELISAMVEDGMGTWLRADPVGRLLWAQPARRRAAAASARRRAEFMEDPCACEPCGPFLSQLLRAEYGESGTERAPMSFRALLKSLTIRPSSRNDGPGWARLRINDLLTPIRC